MQTLDSVFNKLGKAFNQCCGSLSSLIFSGKDQVCPRSREWQLYMSRSSKLKDISLPSICFGHSLKM